MFNSTAYFGLAATIALAAIPFSKVDAYQLPYGDTIRNNPWGIKPISNKELNQLIHSKAAYDAYAAQQQKNKGIANTLMQNLFVSYKFSNKFSAGLYPFREGGIGNLLGNSFFQYNVNNKFSIGASPSGSHFGYANNYGFAPHLGYQVNNKLSIGSAFPSMALGALLPGLGPIF